jgi:hypothetical protein
MVTNRDGIARQTQNISDSSNIGKQKFSLECHTVAITAGHLQYRLTPSLFYSQAAADGRKAHYGALVVSNINGINFVFKNVDMVKHFLNVGPFRRAYLAGYYELTGV